MPIRLTFPPTPTNLSPIMTSMAATLAASAFPTASAPTSATQQARPTTASVQTGGVPQVKEQTSVPARYEEALDVEGDVAIKEVELSGLVSWQVHFIRECVFHARRSWREDMWGKNY